MEKKTVSNNKTEWREEEKSVITQKLCEKTKIIASSYQWWLTSLVDVTKCLVKKLWKLRAKVWRSEIRKLGALDDRKIAVCAFCLLSYLNDSLNNGAIIKHTRVLFQYKRDYQSWLCDFCDFSWILTLN